MGVHGEILDLKALLLKFTAGLMHTELALLPPLIEIFTSALSEDHPARDKMLARLNKAKDQTKITVGYQFFSELLLDVYEDVIPYLEEVVLQQKFFACNCMFCQTEAFYARPLLIAFWSLCFGRKRTHNSICDISIRHHQHSFSRRHSRHLQGCC